MQKIQGQSPIKKVKFCLYSPFLKRAITLREFKTGNFKIVDDNIFNVFFIKPNKLIFKPFNKTYAKR